MKGIIAIYNMKFGKPEDVSIIVSILLSNRTGFITGSNFVIDGGQTRSIG